MPSAPSYVSVLRGDRASNEEARSRGLFCIGFTGKRGGPMSGLCDIALEVPSLDTPKIQEGHLILGHILCGLVENAMFAPAA